MSRGNDLKLALRDQPHGLGAVRVHNLEWVTPPEWKTEVLELPAGQVLPLTVTVTTVEDGVLVDVAGETTLHGLCMRCLDPVSVPTPIAAAEVFAQTPQSSRARSRRADANQRDIEVEGDDFDAAYVIEQDSVDLETLLRDAIFGDAPLRPVCREDCPGICEHCGIRLEDAPADHHHEFLDPRFAALQVLLDQSNDDE